MRNAALARVLAATTVGLTGQAAAAQELKSTYADVTANIGYSSDPFLETSGGSGSPFVTLSARLTHRWFSERTSTEITGYWEGSEYFHYRLRNLLSLHAQTKHSINERLDLSASGGLTADYSGELANRFLSLPQPGEPVGPPVIGGPPADTYLYGGHQYRADGNVGLSWHSSERSQIFAVLGASRVKLSQAGLRDHTIESLSAGYLRSISQETDVAAHLTATATQFDGSDDAAIIINPAATIRSHLSQEWTIAGSAGLSFSRVRHSGVDLHSTEPSFSASLCHDSLSEHLCVSAAHYTHSSAVAELITATTAGIDWVKKLDARQTVQLSAGYMHFNHPLGQITSFRSSQYRGAASYSRLLSDRLSVGAEATARGYAGGGPGHGTDVSGSLFLRYRWGKLG